VALLLTCLLLLVGFVAKTATGRIGVGRGMTTPRWKSNFFFFNNQLRGNTANGRWPDCCRAGLGRAGLFNNGCL
jgi:hypothetical protein